MFETQAKIVRIDKSKQALRTWYSQGFLAVRIKLVDKSCRVCRSLRDTEFYIWNLLTKDHPLYRLTHPNCNCGMIPVEESNIKDKNFNAHIGYRIQVEKLSKQKKSINPPKSEPKTQEETKPETDNIDWKIVNIEKELKWTDNKLDQLEETEKEQEAKGRPFDDSHTKDYLTRYKKQLDKKLEDRKKDREKILSKRKLSISPTPL